MKNLQNLGKALSKAEQKTVNGGMKSACYRRYIAAFDNVTCFVPNVIGGFGTIVNGQCCI